MKLVVCILALLMCLLSANATDSQAAPEQTIAVFLTMKTKVGCVRDSDQEECTTSCHIPNKSFSFTYKTKDIDPSADFESGAFLAGKYSILCNFQYCCTYDPRLKRLITNFEKANGTLNVIQDWNTLYKVKTESLADVPIIGVSSSTHIKASVILSTFIIFSVLLL